MTIIKELTILYIKRIIIRNYFINNQREGLSNLDLC